jgi:hypothetical protein
MTPAEIIEELSNATEGEGILYDNLNEALVGICRRFSQPPVAMYSYGKCIEILMRDLEGEDLSDEQRYEMAVEHFEFNTMGAWVGEYTPAFLYCDGEE